MAQESMFGIANIFDSATADNVDIRDRALKVAQLQPGRASVYGAAQAGGMLMQNLAGMAGMKTAQQEKAEIITNIMKEAQNMDPNDANSYRNLANKFIQSGLPGIGQKFLDKSREVQVKNISLGQTEKQLEQADTRLELEEQRLTSTEKYQDATILNAEETLAFNRQKELTDQANLEAQLKIDADALARDIAAGTLIETQDKRGNTIYQVSTIDSAGNRTIKPFTMEMSEEMYGSDKESSVAVNEDGAIIKSSAVEEWSTADNNKFDNIWDQYKKEFYRAGSTWDNGRWQLSEADIEAGKEEVPKFYDWVKETLGENSAEIVDRGLGGDQADKRLRELLEEEERKTNKNLDTSETEINYQALSEETEVSVSKLKEVPNQIAGEGNPEGYTFGELVTMFKQEGHLEGVEILLKEMKPGTKTEKKKKEFNRFGIKGQ